MENNPQKPAPQGEQEPVANPQQHNPKNPFRDDAPAKEPSPEEEAELEQQRKEALTERD